MGGLRPPQSAVNGTGVRPTEIFKQGLKGGSLSAYAIGKKMLADGLPTSIFIASDLMALAFMRALYEAGVSVPNDISVVGFDDNEFAPHMYPPLTTVRQSFGTVGARCMSILLDLIEGACHCVQLGYGCSVMPPRL